MSVSKERNLYMDRIEGIPLKVESNRKDIHFMVEAIERKEQPIHQRAVRFGGL